jgi:hypothetical protein
MSKFSDDLVGGAVVLIFTHQCFEFCKFLVDKLATMPQPSSPTVTGFTNPLKVSLVTDTPQPAGFPFTWSSSPFPPAIPLAQRVLRSDRRTFLPSSFLAEEANAQVVVFPQQETKTALGTDARGDRRHNDFTEQVEKCIKDRPDLKLDLYRSRESRKKAVREIARLVYGTADFQNVPKRLNQYLGRAYPNRDKKPPKHTRRCKGRE